MLIPLKAFSGDILPPSTLGIADEPKTINSKEVLLYVIKQTDILPNTASETTPQGPFFTCRMSPVVIRSMTDYAYPIRGVTESTITYDVSGYAIQNTKAATIICRDAWVLYKNSAPNSPNCSVVQTTIVQAGQKGISASDSPEKMPILYSGAQKQWEETRARSGSDKRTEREKASDKLRPLLLRSLASKQRAQVNKGEEVTVSISGLDHDLQKQAQAYIELSGGRLLENDPNSSFTLVFLPQKNAPTGTLGINQTNADNTEIWF
jgi:hypothetical protein